MCVVEPSIEALACACVIRLRVVYVFISPQLYWV